MPPKKSVYVVIKGMQPGIYFSWSGENGAEKQIRNFSNSLFKGFSTIEEAESWLIEQGYEELLNDFKKKSFFTNETFPKNSKKETEILKQGKVIIYTDGGALKNPGPGGYGIVMLYKNHRKEFSGGFRFTTNNRMELLACIVGLTKLKYPCNVILFSDSAYVVNGINKGWAKKWKKNNWMRTKEYKAKNADLWNELLKAIENNKNVQFRWVKGHAGNPNNERCDILATKAATQKNLPKDKNFK